MTTTLYYDRLLASMPDGLERDVYRYLIDHADQNALKPDIIKSVFGTDEQDTKNKPLDRKLRLAVYNLKTQHPDINIYSFTDEAGYYLDTKGNRELFQKYIAGMESRKSHIEDDIKAAYMNFDRLQERVKHGTPANVNFIERHELTSLERAEQGMLFPVIKVCA